MLNEVILAGRIVELPPLAAGSNELFCQMRIAVRRSALEPEEETVFPVRIWKGLASVANEKYQLGTAVAIRGRLDICEDAIVIIAERVLFIAAEGQ